MKISTSLALSGLFLFASCRAGGDEPQPTPTPEAPHHSLTLGIAPEATTLSLSAAPLEASGQSYLDLNGNGGKDAGEELSSTKRDYTLPSGTTSLRIYGDLSTLDLTGSPVVQIQGKGLASLTEIKLAKTSITDLNLGEIIKVLSPSGEGTVRTLHVEEEKLSTPLIQSLEAKGWRILRPNGTTIDPKEPTLIIRLQPKDGAKDGQSLNYEFGVAKGLWLDKNYNGVKDQGEDLPDGMGILEHPRNGHPSVYIFHGSAATLDVYPPSGDGGDDEEETDEGETETNSLLNQSPTASLVAMEVSLDISRFPMIGVVSWSEQGGLVAIEATGAKQLVNLSIGHNPIRELNLPTPSVLRTLVITQSELTSLDLSAQTKLQTLSASKGKLQKISLPRALDLTTLNLADNSLTELDLTEQPNLKNVRLENNHLAKLIFGAPKYENLEYLNASSNKLVKLDFRPLVKTRRISVSHNPLTEVLWPRVLDELQVASTELTLLDLTPVQGQTSFLQSLDASDNPKLREVRVVESLLLKTLKLKGTPSLDLALLATSLPQLSAGREGSLSIELQRLSPEQQSQIKARGWKFVP